MKWRIAKSSIIGTSHKKLGTECQDAHAAEVIDGHDQGLVLACIVSDGAGSAAKSRDGSALACRTFLRSVTDWWSSQPCSLPTEDETKGWLFDVSAAITELAERELSVPRDYACTLVAAVVCDFGSVYLQVGDGGIVAAENNLYRPIFWPEETEAANLTSFITDETWWQHLQVSTRTEQPTELALFSDGLQFLVLDYSTRTAHAPFFEQLFSQLRQCSVEHLGALDDALASYLSSEVVSSKTDDDKSLVLVAAM